MDNSASQVGEIFTEAGSAFNKLAEMIIMLHPIAEQIPGTQAKAAVRRKITEEKPVINNTTSNTSSQHLHPGTISQQVTLNMLNAPEPEIEVETIGNEVKLEFEASPEK